MTVGALSFANKTQQETARARDQIVRCYINVLVFESSVFVNRICFSLALSSVCLFLGLFLGISFHWMCLWFICRLPSIFIEKKRKKATHNTIRFFFCKCQDARCFPHSIESHLVSIRRLGNERKKKKAREWFSAWNRSSLLRKNEMKIIFLWKLWVFTVKHSKTTIGNEPATCTYTQKK